MSEQTLTKVMQMASELGPNEQLELVEGLARNLRRNKSPKERKSLYGIWKGKFPETFDIDQALKEVRSEWEAELNEP